MCIFIFFKIRNDYMHVRAVFETNQLYAWWKPNDIGRSYVQNRRMHPRAKMEGPPRPFLPRATKHLTPALLGPTQGPPRIYTRQLGCRGPQDLPCARPIKRLIRHCLKEIEARNIERYIENLINYNFHSISA